MNALDLINAALQNLFEEAWACDFDEWKPLDSLQEAQTWLEGIAKHDMRLGFMDRDGVLIPALYR